MKNILNKLFLVLALFVNFVISFGQTMPPPPENPEGGDGGAASNVPIDMYSILLVAAAFLIILYFARAKKLSFNR